MSVGTVSITTAGYGPAPLETNLNDRNDTTKTGKYKIRQYSISTPQPELAYHVPDEGEERIIRLEDGDRLVEFIMTVYGSSRDVLDSNINDLRRLCREASRHELDDAFPLYYLTTQPQGATSATYHDIKAGWFDDSRSHWTAVGEVNTVAYETVLFLVLAPYSRRAAITLENYLPSSAHFLEDSDSDGLADGWEEVGTAGTPTIETASMLIGHQSQKMTATSGATNQGIQSDLVTCAQSSFLNAFIWIRTATGCDDIRIAILDGSNNVVVSKTFETPDDAGGVADYSVVERTGGFTWYRVSMSGVNSSAANARLQIIRTSAAASASSIWYMDGAYLNVGNIAPPSDGWISSRRTENNNSLDTEADINYCDVWGIPGDVDALAVWKLEAQSLGLGFYMGRMTDGKTRASEQIHWLDSADGTGTTLGTGAWSTVNNAALAGNSSARFTEANGNGGYFEWTLSGDAARKFARTPRTVLALVLVDAVDATFKLGVYGDSGNTDFASHNAVVNPAVAGAYTLLKLGTIDLQGVLPDDVPDTTEPDIVLRVTLSGMTNTEKADIDAIFMPPVLDDYMVYHITEGNGFGANELWLNGHTKQIIPESRGFDRHDWQGSMWTLAPGQVMNRLVFMTFAHTSQFTFDLTAGFNWKLEVTPRGRHLIGSR